jgi:hypothetical protein
MIVHGEAGAGKSWLGDTTPAPRVILDAEGGSRFTPSNKVQWDPTKEPPTPDGTWDTAIVFVRDFNTVAQVYQWLNSGKHPFKSVILDSLTEIQKRCIDQIAGDAQLRTQDWGEVLRRMEKQVRDFRDLTMHPQNPLEAVIYINLTAERDGSKRPAVQGSLGVSLPGFVDVVGYLFVEVLQETNELKRRMLVAPYNGIVAKDRTNRLGMVVDDPNVVSMLDTIYNN